ncbi:PREDICTED: uncharacterized protein LOC106906928 [Poecilia mexicana]|uniref:uncharacterized protein LOC103153327 n=1 Tax=Poecilia formosa TaxID=48698 RepID=UPI00072DD76A|nr:PREDICTED: uncharacterized protein LOC103153327 [Poecilia formosa]XP_014827890.1 PREDICTED: uncharacterized protein LOC106906928 [Poecilia mexicana]
MRAYALRLASSGRFVKATLIFQAEEMSTFASPTIPSSQLTSDQLTVLVASFSSLVFFFVVIVLLSIIYRKDPQCCKHGSYQDPHADMDAPPQYYSSRQTLVGSPCLEQTHIPEDSVTQLPGELFYVGLPSSYSLPALEATLPRLPSYESVRKKDRQRQIHMMIADRFGLNGPIVTESPPSYEESIRQSVELPCDILPSDLDVPLPQRAYMSVSPGYTTDSTILPPV